jgi:hypothetical protein
MQCFARAETEPMVIMEKYIQPGLIVAGGRSVLMYAITSSISLGVNRWPKGGMARLPSRITVRACREVGCGFRKKYPVRFGAGETWPSWCA